MNTKSKTERAPIYWMHEAIEYLGLDRLVPYSKIRLIKNKKSHAAVLISLAIDVFSNAGKAMLIRWPLVVKRYFL